MGGDRVDLVVVGAGPAGLAAATETARCGGRVVVVDEAPVPGGRLPGQVHLAKGRRALDPDAFPNKAAYAVRLLKAAAEAGVTLVCGASVWGLFPGWHLALASAGGARVPTGFDARTVVLATGAVQNPLMLPGWTLPGVITAGAAQQMVNVHRVLPGRRPVVIGIDPLSLSIAQLLGAVGAQVQGVFLPPANGLSAGPASPRAALAALVRFAPHAAGIQVKLAAALARRCSAWAARIFPIRGLQVAGLPLRLRQAACSIHGDGRAREVRVAALTADGTLLDGRLQRFSTDVVITSDGLSPLVELAQVAGCPLHFLAELGGWVPVHGDRLQTPLPGLFVAGSLTGVEGAAVAECQGRIAGLAVAEYLGLGRTGELAVQREAQQRAAAAARREALVFLPGIERGRAAMQRLWENNPARHKVD